jgi:uncharacterized Zn finger protein
MGVATTKMSWWYYSNRRQNSGSTSNATSADAGICAQSTRGNNVQNWWAKRWQQTLETLIDSKSLRQGRLCLRKGHVLMLEPNGASITAEVQSTRFKPYQVNIKFMQFSPEVWRDLTQQMSEQAIFAAQLLRAELPCEIELLFEQMGYSLFPQTPDDWQTHCNCTEEAVCKHIAAVCHLLAEYFDGDPMLILQLRGGECSQILKTICHNSKLNDNPDLNSLAMLQINAKQHNIAHSHAKEALPTDLTNFWKMQPLTATWNVALKSPPTQMPILRRLGPPDFIGDDLHKCLQRIYRSVSEKVLELADQELDK